MVWFSRFLLGRFHGTHFLTVLTNNIFHLNLWIYARIPVTFSFTIKALVLLESASSLLLVKLYLHKITMVLPETQHYIERKTLQDLNYPVSEPSGEGQPSTTHRHSVLISYHLLVHSHSHPCEYSFTDWQGFPSESKWLLMIPHKNPSKVEKLYSKG